MRKYGREHMYKRPEFFPFSIDILHNCLLVVKHIPPAGRRLFISWSEEEVSLDHCVLAVRCYLSSWRGSWWGGRIALVMGWDLQFGWLECGGSLDSCYERKDSVLWWLRGSLWLDEGLMLVYGSLRKCVEMFCDKGLLGCGAIKGFTVDVVFALRGEMSTAKEKETFRATLVSKLCSGDIYDVRSMYQWIVGLLIADEWPQNAGYCTWLSIWCILPHGCLYRQMPWRDDFSSFHPSRSMVV